MECPKRPLKPSDATATSDVMSSSCAWMRILILLTLSKLDVFMGNRGQVQDTFRSWIHVRLKDGFKLIDSEILFYSIARAEKPQRLNTNIHHPTWRNWRGSARKNGKESPNPGVKHVLHHSQEDSWLYELNRLLLNTEQRVWIITTMWCFSFSFLINLQKTSTFQFFSGIIGIDFDG